MVKVSWLQQPQQDTLCHSWKWRPGLHSQPSLVGLSTAVVWEEEVGTAKKLTLLYIYEGTLIPVGIEVLRQGGGSLAVTPLPECKGD